MWQETCNHFDKTPDINMLTERKDLSGSTGQQVEVDGHMVGHFWTENHGKDLRAEQTY